jgi:hypothetical protein
MVAGLGSFIKVILVNGMICGNNFHAGYFIR